MLARAIRRRLKLPIRQRRRLLLTEWQQMQHTIRDRYWFASATA
jgi:hypothetical protein